MTITGISVMLIPDMKTAGNGTPEPGNTRQFGKLDYFKITILGFALTSLWSSLHTIILPLRLLDFVPAAHKNTNLDMLVLTGLVVGMLAQPVAGAFSDCCSLSWGRRRPFILAGTLILLLLLSGVVLSGRYAVIFIIYLLMQIASNVAQGPYQAFIPDLVPEEKRGRAAGVRGLFLGLGGIIFVRIVASTMNGYPLPDSGPWISLLILGILVLLSLAITIFMVREKPSPGQAVSPLATVLNSFKISTKVKTPFILFLVASFLIFSAWNTMLAHALYYFQDVLHVSSPAEIAGNLIIAMGVGLLAVVYFAGLLTDKIGRRPVIVGAGFLGALGTIALYFSTNLWQVLLCGMLLGMCAGAWVSSQWALATDLVGKTEAGKYIGLVNLSVAVAGVLSRLIGPLIDALNAGGTHSGYQVMLLVCVIYFLAGSVILLRVKSLPSAAY
jgi:Na+/melibiose symporter-like transporter